MLREPEPKHMQRPLAIYTIFIQYNALIPGTLQTVHTYALSLYEDGHSTANVHVAANQPAAAQSPSIYPAGNVATPRRLYLP